MLCSAGERARWFFAGRRLNIYDSGRKTSAAQISEAEAETGDKGLRSPSSDDESPPETGDWPSTYHPMFSDTVSRLTYTFVFAYTVNVGYRDTYLKCVHTAQGSRGRIKRTTDEYE